MYRVEDVCGYAFTRDNQTLTKYCIEGDLLSNPPASCSSDEKCLTLADAEAAYAPGWGYNEANVCGYAFSLFETLPKYCTSGTPKLSGQTVGVPAIVTVLPVNPILPVNAGDVSSDQIPRVLGGKRQTGVIDSFLWFFSGIFSHPSCPTGQTVCNGKCLDLMTDSQNCGSCDYTCFDPAVCIGGQCVVPGPQYEPPAPWPTTYMVPHNPGCGGC
jgi:hypothetical protein